ncbi:hypothetical protein ABVK25_000847 [Lepraria finkii]|uniref:Thiolase-like protein type 1 additional C-terminal domain-containing protein n=1 Tax=Lepraria finkii TaxID=1340010 RepID=A0ABR4BR98_9LECA
MATGQKTPIVIAIGESKNRPQKVEDAIEPMQLMLQATLNAVKDAGLAATAEKELQSNIDSVSVVATWTWPYADLPGLLSQKLGIQPQHTIYSEQGGNQPMKLVDEAARRIMKAESNVAVVTGGEALASLSAYKTTKRMPPPGWTSPDAGVKAASPLKISNFGKSIGTLHSIGLPLHVYPLYENAFRAHRGQSIEQNNTESAQLYAEFAKVAEHNHFSWNYGQPAPTAETISTVTKNNRMICFPYPLLMNAYNKINLAGSCILTSTEYAKELGVPENKWIYPLGGAGTQDSDSFWERPNYYSSPSISRSLDACLEISGLTKEQIDVFDFYSCFPIVPKLACQHLGLPSTKSPKPITLLGGLTSFGGAGNNYSMHSLTAMVRELRNGNGQHGLILANGGLLTYQHVVCLSTRPRRDGSAYPDRNPLPPYVTDVLVPSISAQPEGEAVVETYTVEFNRNGAPSKGFIVGRLTRNNHRFVANTSNTRSLEQLSSGTREPIGRTGWVKSDDLGRNSFVFDDPSRL